MMEMKYLIQAYIINEWNKIKTTKVYYLSKDNVKISKLRELIQEVNPQIIYINSVFSTLSIFVMVIGKVKADP